MFGVALTDAVGERRTMNQPGTDKEYPNWQVPLADELGHPVLLVLVDDISTGPRLVPRPAAGCQLAFGRRNG